MATRHGKNGVVKVGSNAVAEVQDFSITESVRTDEDTAMGDTDETHLVGIKSWSGSLKCWFDPTDTNGQNALDVGASVTLKLYAEGSASGAEELSGTATITEVTRNVNKGGVVERSFNFKGNGALTAGVVA